MHKRYWVKETVEKSKNDLIMFYINKLQENLIGNSHDRRGHLFSLNARGWCSNQDKSNYFNYHWSSESFLKHIFLFHIFLYVALE